jgi:hypothetical protein
MITEKTCSTCGAEKSIDQFWKSGIKNDIQEYKSECNECAKLSDRKQYRKNTFRTLFNNTKKRASKLDRAFTITKDDLVMQYVTQQGLCYYTNLPMDLDSKGNKNKRNIISIDRIDSTKGYTPDNIVLCRFIVNQMKSVLSIEDFKYEILESYKRTVAMSNVGLPQIMSTAAGYATLFCPYCECSGDVHLMVRYHLPACTPKLNEHDYR